MGISGDEASNLLLFRKTHNLTYTLLSDEKGDIAKKFGIPVKPGGIFKYKGPDGNVSELRRGVSIARFTVIIDRDRNIAAIDPINDPAGDGKRVVQLVKKLGTN